MWQTNCLSTASECSYMHRNTVCKPLSRVNNTYLVVRFCHCACPANGWGFNQRWGSMVVVGSFQNSFCWFAAKLKPQSFLFITQSLKYGHLIKYIHISYTYLEVWWCKSCMKGKTNRSINKCMVSCLFLSKNTIFNILHVF